MGFLVICKNVTSLSQIQGNGSIPAEWILAPTNVTEPHTCPSPKSTLVAFAITNLATLLLTIPFCNRFWLRNISCHVLGSGRKISLLYGWVITVGCKLLGNYIVAKMITSTPGYEGLSKRNIVLLYLARPRISWIALGPLRFFLRKRHESHFLGAFISTVISEIILTYLGGWFLVSTWSDALKKKQVFVCEGAGFLILPLLITMVVVGCGLLGLLLLEFYSWLDFHKRHSEWNGEYLCGDRSGGFLLFLPLAVTYFICSWIYFSIFLRSAGEKWCPPKLGLQAFIWVAFGWIGTIIGGGV